MGMLWTNNSWRDRLKRLTLKLGASPVVPVLGWSKVLESVVAGGPEGMWAVVAVVASGWYVVAEDAVEYVAQQDLTIQEWFNR